MKVNPLLKKHICPICKKEQWIFCVHEVNQKCPCVDCHLKKLGKE